MKRERQGIGGALVLVLCGIAAVCLDGCGETSHGLTDYRDKEVAVPAAKTGIKAGAERAPTGNLCIINVRRDGSVWTRRGDTPTNPDDLPRLIADAYASKGCLVLRCDRSARWKHVVPVLAKLLTANVPRLWFCVENEGGAFVDYQFPESFNGNILRTEYWLGIKTMGKEDVDATPWLAFDMRPMKDWGQVRDRLQLIASIPGSKDDPFVLDAASDAFFGWVIRALDLLSEFGFHDIEFRGVTLAEVPEPEEAPDPDLPIEDIPIEPEAKPSR